MRVHSRTSETELSDSIGIDRCKHFPLSGANVLRPLASSAKHIRVRTALRVFVDIPPKLDIRLPWESVACVWMEK